VRTLQLAPSGMEREAAAPVSALASLPRMLACAVFAHLPLRDRARAALVCRAWRDVSYDASLWTRLVLPAGQPYADDAFSALLLGAVSRARGSLAELHLSGGHTSHGTQTILPAVLALNARALRRLRLGLLPTTMRGTVDAEWLHRLRAAAPGLETLEADAQCELQDAAGVLDAAAPRAPLRVRNLRVTGAGDSETDGAALTTLAPSLGRHTSLTHVTLCATHVDAPGALDALVDGGLRACRVPSVNFARCSLGPPAVPALARLLAAAGGGGGALTSLNVRDVHEWLDLVGDEADMMQATRPLCDAATAPVLAAALRASATLTALTLDGVVDFWRDGDVAVTLLGALTAHPRLHTLCVVGAGLTFAVQHAEHAPPLQPEAAVASAVALGALIAANAPALTAMDVSGGELNDDHLRVLFAALPANTNLRSLDLRGNALSAACLREHGLPAVRANTSLRDVQVQLLLHTHGYDDDHAAVMAELAALLAARGA
jgi:hypothetical protein